jgi:hypothetical protein
VQILTPEYAKVMSEELAAVERGGIRQGVSAKVLYYCFTAHLLQLYYCVCEAAVGGVSAKVLYC